MRIIPLTKGLEAMVDDEDLAKISVYKWHASFSRNSVYAKTDVKANGRRRTVFMHHLVIGNPATGLVVDHINGNGLDNGRSNLRFATFAQNCWNARKTVRGYVFIHATGKWQARIRSNGRRYSLGEFYSKEEAAECYFTAEAMLRGDFLSSVRCIG